MAKRGGRKGRKGREDGNKSPEGAVGEEGVVARGEVVDKGGLAVGEGVAGPYAGVGQEHPDVAVGEALDVGVG